MSADIDDVDPRSWLAGYDAGHAVGELRGEERAYAAGYAARLQDEADERAAADDAWRDRLVRDIAAQAAGRIPYDELAERRGQHDRAEAQRRLLRERGIS